MAGASCSPATWCPRPCSAATRSSGLGDGSVYDVLESSAHVAIQHGVVTIEPMAADRSLARKLKIPAGSLLLYLRQVDYDRSGDPVLLSHEYHLGDAFEFSVVRRGPGRRFR